ncbi:MAG TPA: hypothetical protein VGD41_12575 [Pyrinomonadaceae bacterium]
MVSEVWVKGEEKGRGVSGQRGGDRGEKEQPPAIECSKRQTNERKENDRPKEAPARHG